MRVYERMCVLVHGQGGLPGRPEASAMLHSERGPDLDGGRENILDRVVGGKEGKCEGSGRAEEAGERGCRLVGSEGTYKETKSEQ